MLQIVKSRGYKYMPYNLGMFVIFYEEKQTKKTNTKNNMLSRHVTVKEPLSIIRLDDSLINFVSDLLKRALQEHIIIALLI